jgi:hypothetical protein
MRSWYRALPCLLAVPPLILWCRLLVGQEPAEKYPYSAGMYAGGLSIVLFPLAESEARELTLPVPLGGYTISPDGVSLYTTPAGGDMNSRPQPNTVFRISFHPIGVTSLANVSRFRFISSMAISIRGDQAVIAGRYWTGTSLVCGVFILDFGAQGVRPVLTSDDCEDAITRTDISLSPDSQHAVAIHARVLESIDITTGTVRKIGDGFLKAAWAPNGTWVAAAAYSAVHAQTTIFDATTFATIKVVPSSTVLRVSWSPDSRYLLSRTLEPGCGPDEYSYAAYDLRTGRFRVIDSSRCRVLGNDIGWIVN